jgi:hypothetical protein
VVSAALAAVWKAVTWIVVSAAICPVASARTWRDVSAPASAPLIAATSATVSAAISAVVSAPVWAVVSPAMPAVPNAAICAVVGAVMALVVSAAACGPVSRATCAGVKAAVWAAVSTFMPAVEIAAVWAAVSPAVPAGPSFRRHNTWDSVCCPRYVLTAASNGIAIGRSIYCLDTDQIHGGEIHRDRLTLWPRARPNIIIDELPSIIWISSPGESSPRYRFVLSPRILMMLLLPEHPKDSYRVQ